MKSITKILLMALFVTFFTACLDNNDEEKKQEITAFVELHTKAGTQITWAETDEGESLYFNPYITAIGATTPDSVYRALLVYEQSKENTHVKPLDFAFIPVLNWNETQLTQSNKQDPVEFESIWISKNKKYLNISFFVYTGETADNTKKQTIGAALNSVTQNKKGGKTYQFTLLHTQNNVPENYKAQSYTSIPIKSLSKLDEVSVKIYTYSGEINKTLAVEK